MEKDHDDDVAYIDDDEDADYEEEEDYLFAVFDDCKIFEEKHVLLFTSGLVQYYMTFIVFNFLIRHINAVHVVILVIS